MNQKRINLCFDLDDERQRTAYHYIQSSGREKTSTIVNLVLREAIPPADDRKNENKLAQRLESIIKENTSQTDIGEIHSGINQILSKLDIIHSTIVQPQQDFKKKQVDTQKEPYANQEIEMSEDAFSSMMSFLDP